MTPFSIQIRVFILNYRNHFTAKESECWHKTKFTRRFDCLVFFSKFDLMNLTSEFIFALMVLLFLKEISTLCFTSYLLILVPILLSKAVLPLFKNKFLNLIRRQMGKLELHLIKLLVLVDLICRLRFLRRLNLTHLKFKLTNFGNVPRLKHRRCNWSKSTITTAIGTIDGWNTWETNVIWESTLAVLSLSTRLV